MTIHGDCTEIMKTMDSDSIDLILTDPPYGIDFQSSRMTERLRKPKIANDKEPYVEWMDEAYRLLKSGGAMFCFYRWDVADAFIKKAKQVGFNLKSEIIWDKGIHGMGDLFGAYAPQHETILFCTKGSFKFRGKRPTSVIRTQRVQPEQLIHPNEKPVDLLRKLILDTTEENDTVLDCFSGSGATGRACKDLNRKFIGIEIDETYVEKANARLGQEVLL